jgi:hypothetical protein
MRPVLFPLSLAITFAVGSLGAQPPPDRYEPGSSEPEADFVSGGNPDGHRTWLALELSPLDAFLYHSGGSIEITPLPHHSLILTGYYMLAHDIGDPITGAGGRTYQTAFSGYGGEVGYRYYFGRRGPHGLFLGPSLLLGSFQAALQRTGQTEKFTNLGGALDFGYQAVVYHIVISLGVGIQYVAIPGGNELSGYGFPINANAQEGVEPRALLSLGYAL